MICTFHLRDTTSELRLQPRVCPSDGLGAASGVDPWHLLEKCSIKCEPKQRIQKGACCREPHDGSIAKPVDLRLTRPSRVSVTSGFPFRGLVPVGPASTPAPPRPLLQLVCLPAPTSFLCIFLFQPLLDTCPSCIGGSCPTLLPKTLGNGSKHHGSKLYPGRAPGLEFVSGHPPEWVELHSALPSPSPPHPQWGCSSFCQPSPGIPWRMGQSISVPACRLTVTF